MVKRKILRKGMMIALTVATFAARSAVHADDSEPGDRGISELIVGVIAGQVMDNPVGAGVGAFLYPSRTATDEEEQRLTDEYRRRESSSLGNYRRGGYHCSGCAAQ